MHRRAAATKTDDVEANAEQPPQADGARAEDAYLHEDFWNDNRDYWIAQAGEMIGHVLTLPLLENSVCKRKLQVIASSRFWPYTKLRLWMIGRQPAR